MPIIGLDVGKDELFACLRDEGRKTKQAATHFANTPTGHHKMLSWLRKITVGRGQTHVVMESTSVYWESIAICLHEAGHLVSVVNAAQIRFFAKSLLRRGKTD
uniref:IS110 family transposase n=1 Tax=Deinococcus sp. TaxID=47478 RepID=UPI0028699A72